MHAKLPLALLSPLVPSVLSRVRAEMGPTFWKLQKCAAFRRMHRYQLHVAPVVAFSFCFENGAPAAKWKMGGLWREASLPPTLGVVVKHGRHCMQVVATLAPKGYRFSKTENRPQNGNDTTRTLCDLSLALCLLPTYFLFSKI